MKLWMLLAVICGSVLPTFANEITKLDPMQPYSAKRSNPVTYDIEFQVVVTAPYKTKQLRVWLPIPTSDVGQEVLSSELVTFPETVQPLIANEPLFGNRFAYFEFSSPQGGQIITHKLKIKVWELRWNVDSANIQSVKEWPTSFSSYRRNESQAVVTDDRFEKLLQQIVPQRRGGMNDLNAVMTWVSGNFTYDHANASLAGSSLHAFEQRRGHCSDYHGFCAAMGRLIGQPTRITYGINTFPKNSPSHCKLEAFLPPYGWVSFDVSETQRLAQSLSTNKNLSDADRATFVAAANRRLVSGFRDNTWYLQTRGSDYDLAPKATTKVPVVRTIYAEADGKALTEPDPGNANQTAFPWMTAHKFQPDHAVTYPFTDINSLADWRRQ